MQADFCGPSWSLVPSLELPPLPTYLTASCGCGNLAENLTHEATVRSAAVTAASDAAQYPPCVLPAALDLPRASALVALDRVKAVRKAVRRDRNKQVAPTLTPSVSEVLQGALSPFPTRGSLSTELLSSMPSSSSANVEMESGSVMRSSIALLLLLYGFDASRSSALDVFGRAAANFVSETVREFQLRTQTCPLMASSGWLALPTLLSCMNVSAVELLSYYRRAVLGFYPQVIKSELKLDEKHRKLVYLPQHAERADFVDQSAVYITSRFSDVDRRHAFLDATTTRHFPTLYWQQPTMVQQSGNVDWDMDFLHVVSTEERATANAAAVAAAAVGGGGGGGAASVAVPAAGRTEAGTLAKAGARQAKAVTDQPKTKPTKKKQEAAAAAAAQAAAIAAGVSSISASGAGPAAGVTDAEGEGKAAAAPGSAGAGKPKTKKSKAATTQLAAAEHGESSESVALPAAAPAAGPVKPPPTKKARVAAQALSASGGQESAGVSSTTISTVSAADVIVPVAVGSGVAAAAAAAAGTPAAATGKPKPATSTKHRSKAQLSAAAAAVAAAGEGGDSGATQGKPMTSTGKASAKASAASKAAAAETASESHMPPVASRARSNEPKP